MEIISNSPYFLFVPKSTTESHFTEVYLSATDIFSFWVFPGLSILTFLSSLLTQLAVTAECKNICAAAPAGQYVSMSGRDIFRFHVLVFVFAFLSLSLSLSSCLTRAAL